VEQGTCTIEEREEFEPLVEMGFTVYAGIDHGQVLREAESESQVIIWDGGNNDFPFVRSDWEIVLLDALRPGHERLYYPGEVNLRRADLLIVTKVNEAGEESIRRIEKNISVMNPAADILSAPSVIRLDIPNGSRTKGSWSLRMGRQCQCPMEACPLGREQWLQGGWPGNWSIRDLML
jgi:predicted GTPase